MDRLGHDILIVGGGAAGLRAAIAAAEVGSKLSVAIISKVYPMRSHTVSAEGGLAAALPRMRSIEYDSFDLHAFDTIKGSDFLADQDAVEFFVKEAPAEVIQLEHWGCPWSRDPDGLIALRAFGGMSVKRTIFAADKTGFHLLHTLFQRTMMHENITRYDEWFATSLLVENGRVYGVNAIDIKNGELGLIRSKAVIIATGGAGRVYEFTTNGSIKTGDGMAMAYRAGIPLKDMEFVQYHPTALPGTGILMTEASRGEGGYLVNKDGERFLKRYVPKKMELGPRDILSRAIITEIAQGRGVEGPYGSYVFLDVRHLGKEIIERKLPFVKELAENYVGIDPLNEPIPVRPAAHYFMGGVSTDLAGRTEIAGLYTAGEAACVSINGANRLGSNSLTECLVFGAAAGADAAKFAIENQMNASANPESTLLMQEEKRIFDEILGNEAGEERVSTIRAELRSLMERNVGIFRNETALSEAARVIKSLKERFRLITVEDRGRVFNSELLEVLELEMMLDVAEAITHSALMRKESRGAHYRVDYPKRNDEQYLSHSLARYTKEGPRIDYLPVKITKWEPMERVY